MKLTRDKVSEKYEERKSVFDERIPSGYYEVIFRGELSYPLTEYESVWRTSMFLKKDKDTDNFIEDLLNAMKPIKSSVELREQFATVAEIIQRFEPLYCEKHDLLPQDFCLYLVEEDRPTMMAQYGVYHSVTRPFHLFITYNDKGKHYSVK